MLKRTCQIEINMEVFIKESYSNSVYKLFDFGVFIKHFIMHGESSQELPKGLR